MLNHNFKTYWKRFTSLLLVTAMTVCAAGTFPENVFAATEGKYVEDVILYEGSLKDAKEKMPEYTFMDDNITDGLILGYTTTNEKNDAIRDVALLSMDGTFNTTDYKEVLEHKKDDAKKMIDRLQETIEEYRVNYKHGRERALEAHDQLNRYYDDDTGLKMGDYFLDRSIKKEQYTTLFMQCNVKSLQAMQNILAGACDTADNTWIERLQGNGTLDDLVYNMIEDDEEYKDIIDETTAMAYLEENYQDQADDIYGMWENFSDTLVKYEEADVHMDDKEAWDSYIKELEENDKSQSEALTMQQAGMFYETLKGIEYGENKPVEENKVKKSKTKKEKKAKKKDAEKPEKKAKIETAVEEEVAEASTESMVEEEVAEASTETMGEEEAAEVSTEEVQAEEATEATEENLDTIADEEDNYNEDMDTDGDGENTLLDLFLLSTEEDGKYRQFDLEEIYPLLMALSPGQRFISSFTGIETLFATAGKQYEEVAAVTNDEEISETVEHANNFEEDMYKVIDEKIDTFKKDYPKLAEEVMSDDAISVYAGIDRSFYTEGFALTGKAEKVKDGGESGNDSGLFPNSEVRDIVNWVFFGTGIAATVTGVVIISCFSSSTTLVEKTMLEIAEEGRKCNGDWSKFTGFKKKVTVVNKTMRTVGIVAMAIGVALALHSIVSYFIHRNDEEHVHYLEIPTRVADATGGGEDKEPFLFYNVVKNQDGKAMDLYRWNQKNWLVLYTTMSEDAGNPILAKDFFKKVNEKDGVDASKFTGVHQFETEAAQVINGAKGNFKYYFRHATDSDMAGSFFSDNEMVKYFLILAGAVCVVGVVAFAAKKKKEDDKAA